MKILSVPEEIWLMSFRYLEKSDLKSVRLANPTSGKIKNPRNPLWLYCATELLFDRIFLSARSEDVATFLEWTKHPRCSAAVQELIFDASSIDPELSMPHYAESLWNFVHYTLKPLELCLQPNSEMDPALSEILSHVEQECMRGLLRSPVGIERGACNATHAEFSGRDLLSEFEGEQGSSLLHNPLITAGYREYIQEARCAMDTLKSGRLLGHMVQGLKSLPNIKTVSFEDEYMGEATRYKWRFDHGLLKPLFLSGSPFKRSWHPMYLLPFDRLGLGEEDDGQGSATDGPKKIYPAFIQQFELLLRAVSMSERRISGLRLCSRSSSGFPTAALSPLFARPSVILSYLSPVLSTLNTLSVHMGLPFRHEGKCDACEPLQSLLSMIPNFAHLSLRLQGGSSDDFVLDELFPMGFQLPELQSLSLTGMTTSSDLLVKMISSKHLRNLRLKRLELSEDEDEEVIEGIRAVYRATMQLTAMRIDLSGGEKQSDDGKSVDRIDLFLHAKDAVPIVKKYVIRDGEEEEETLDLGLVPYQDW